MTTTLLTPGRALAYSPLSFVRAEQEALGRHVEEALATGLERGAISVAGDAARWYWRSLAWDSEHFGLPVIRIEAAAWDGHLPEPSFELARAAQELRTGLDEQHDRWYAFAELPTEDPVAVQALGLAGFRVVETRLTWFTDHVASAALPERFRVREAKAADIPELRAVAKSARNPFDRYHADPFFGQAVADGYLATYADASVRGLADAVIVPDPGDGEPAGAFFSVTLSRPPQCPVGLQHACDTGISVGRIPLVAVGGARHGWHVRLLSETSRWLAERFVDVACMTTQAANGAVIRNVQKLGYRLGRVTHVLAASRGRADERGR